MQVRPRQAVILFAQDGICPHKKSNFRTFTAESLIGLLAAAQKSNKSRM
jgi:hypothetical protein